MGVMKEKITENILLWDKLKNARKPVILYGMGDGADKILACCKKNKIEVADIFASDEFVRGHYFRGYKVKKLSEIQENIEDFIILVAFATRDTQILERIYELDKKYELYVPDMPVIGSGDFYDCFPESMYTPDESAKFERVYEILEDDKSREVYLDVINFRISGKLKYLQTANTPKSEALALLQLEKNPKMHYVDLGAYDGDSILELLNEYKYSESIGKIIAVEPDRKNFAKLQKNLGENNLLENCTLHNIGVWRERQNIYFSEKAGRHSSVTVPGELQNSRMKIHEIPVDTVDNIISASMPEENCRYFIKYDVEGSEYEAILASAAMLKKYSPALAVSLYHRSEDLVELPLLINKLNPSYKIYLRKHEYIPCWDLNLYITPE